MKLSGIILVLIISLFELSACKKEFEVGGSISGLNGSITIQNNLINNMILTADDTFVFYVSGGSTFVNITYNVTISVQPSGQQCTVANGSGTISGTGANVTDISITCRWFPTVRSGGGAR